jgi:signal transduction histidine kinase
MRDKKGDITDIVYVAKDITANKKAEEERMKLEGQVRHAQKMESIGTIANGIAHNFNNILGAVRGFVEMTLVDVPRDSRANSDLKKAVKGIEDAKELSNKMLLFSREQEQKLERVEIHPIVKGGIELFGASMIVPVEIREDIDTKCSPVLADANEIKQVVMNLCTNAYHAMSEEMGLLEVSLKEVEIDADTARTHPNLHKGRYARITVSDTGHGMDKTTIERIFEPFFTTKGVGKGTGLGLSVVHGTILSHNGDIIVDSELGKGTTFNVYLPLVDDNQNKKEA